MASLAQAWSALAAMLKVYLVIAGGFYLAKRGRYDEATSRGVSKDLMLPVQRRGAAALGTAQILVNLLTPCLLFISLCSALQAPESGAATGLVLGVACIHLIAWFAFGAVLRRVLKPPDDFRNSLIASVCLGNVGDMVFAILLSVGDSPPFAPGDAAVGAGYVSIYATLFSAFVFTVGDALIRSDHERTTTDSDVTGDALATPNGAAAAARPDPKPSAASASSTPGALEMQPVASDSVAAGPMDAGAEADAATAAAAPVMLAKGDRGGLPTEEDEGTDADDSDREAERGEGHRLHVTGTGEDAAGRSGRYRRWRPAVPAKLAAVGRVLWKLVTPPNVAVVFALILGSIPQAMAWLLPPSMTGLDAPQAPLKFLYDSLALFGNASIPLALMNLGAALAKLKLRGGLSLRIVSAVTLCRMLVFPAIGLGLVCLLTYQARLPVLVASPILQFVLIVITGVPTATFVLILTQLHGGDGRSVAAVMMAQYAILWLTMTALIFAAMQVVLY